MHVEQHWLGAYRFVDSLSKLWYAGSNDSCAKALQGRSAWLAVWQTTGNSSPGSMMLQAWESDQAVHAPVAG